jgi:PIN domain nuclease of toxin-antitoxin system
MTTHVLDASAVLALLAAEPGWEAVDSIVDGAMISSVNFGEVLYKVAEQGSDPIPTGRDLQEYGIGVVEFSSAMAGQLPGLRERNRGAERLQADAGVPARKRKRLSLGDMCCLALAIEREAPVMTGDDYWTTLDLPVTVTNYRPR